jgi:hypothetical protein
LPIAENLVHCEVLVPDRLTRAAHTILVLRHVESRAFCRITGVVVDGVSVADKLMRRIEVPAVSHLVEKTDDELC